MTPFQTQIPGVPEAVDPRLWTMELVHNGAIIHARGSTVALVGELRWLSSSAIAWFPAFGDQPGDAHRFTFDAVEATPRQVVFYEDGAAVAEIAPITHARVDDPEDYRIGWQLWLEVAPLRHGFINGCFEQLAPELLSSAAPFPTDHPAGRNAGGPAAAPAPFGPRSLAAPVLGNARPV